MSPLPMAQLCSEGNGKAMNMKGIDQSPSIGPHFGGSNLKDGPGKMFHSLAGRALCGVGFWCYLPGWAG